MCRHCPNYNKRYLTRFNATKGRAHLVTSCVGIDAQAKRQLSNESQAMIRQAKMLTLLGEPTDTLQDLRSRALQLGERALTIPRENDISDVDPVLRPDSCHPCIRRLKLTSAEAVKIIHAEMRTILARGEPPSRLLDNHARAALMERHPDIVPYLPNSVETIYDKYVVKIDMESREELEGFIKKLPGLLNISFDGATVNGKQKVSTCINYCAQIDHDSHTVLKILYTLSKGEFSIFLTWTDLGCTKHVTEAEIADALKVCNDAMETYGCAIASVPVDNAASKVAKAVCLKLPTTVLPSRDPSHSTDLLSKDLATTDVVQAVIEDAKIITKFCKIDRIDSIKQEMMNDGEVEFSTKAVSMSETRMNLVHDYVIGASKQHNFVLLVQRNEKYQEYYQERRTKKKHGLDIMFDRFRNQDMWAKFDMLTSRMTVWFKQVQKACSRADFPLTAFVLLVQALKNDLCRGLDDEFEEVMGLGSKDEVMGMIEE